MPFKGCVGSSSNPPPQLWQTAPLAGALRGSVPELSATTQPTGAGGETALEDGVISQTHLSAQKPGADPDRGRGRPPSLHSVVPSLVSSAWGEMTSEVVTDSS